ncbi:unnamed protein product [Orchesella dallaii]|uniref:Gustatory receptor n=1 Tax=Orchesella dallaii TaxID=48710 RepID=A0ABP1S992_9HEXA
MIENLNLLFSKGVACTAITLPIVFIYGLHLRNPCQATITGFWLLLECSSNGHKDEEQMTLFQLLINSFIKATVFIANHWNWAFAFNVSAHLIVTIQILCTMSLRKYLNVFMIIISNTTNTKRQVSEACVTYRSIQVLALLTNMLLNTTVTGMVFCSILIEALGLAGFVRLEWVSCNFLSLTFCFMMVVNGMFALIVLLGGMAAVYMESKLIFQALKRNLSVYTTEKYKRKFLSRFYKSCRLIRINLGSINFFDTLTPLNCVNFSVNLAVQVLLITN